MKYFPKFALLLALIASNSCRKDQEQKLLPELVPMRVINVEKVTRYPVSRSFVGEIEAARSTTLSFEISGTIDTVTVDEGKTVAKGDLLASLDTERLEARRSQLEAQTDQARAAIILTEAELRRIESLVRTDAATTRQLEQAREAVQRTRAALDQLSAQIQAVDVDLRKSSLRAPFAGTISQRLADNGAVASPGVPVLTLLETGKLEIRVALAQDIRPDEALKVRLPNGETRTFEITRILPQRNPQTRTVDVILTVPTDLAKQGTLRPGDLVTVLLEKEIEEDGIILPSTALIEGSRGLWVCYVTVDDPELGEGAARIARRDLQIIHEYEDRVVVSGALSEADQVLASGLHKVSPGQAIKPQR